MGDLSELKRPLEMHPPPSNSSFLGLARVISLALLLCSEQASAAAPLVGTIEFE